MNNLRLGFRRLRGERIGALEWRPASTARILAMLRHPVYAGAYSYDLHRAGQKNPVTGRREGAKWFVPPDELPVLIQGWLCTAVRQRTTRVDPVLPMKNVADRGPHK